MPFYEYRCGKCGKQFEKIVSISEADKKQVCPYCGGKDTEKLISVFSARFASTTGNSTGGGFT
ncbi:MAG: zinc ribbon domain-containing protein [Syntrophaceae bacterium]|nr:zinc ribbon domain-containing protein [Syntrophaceae bacterium]